MGMVEGVTVLCIPFHEGEVLRASRVNDIVSNYYVAPPQHSIRNQKL